MPAALAPLISDAPIVVLMLFLVNQVPEQLLAYIQVAGGAFMLYLAWRAIRAKVAEVAVEATPSESATSGIWNAAVMNLLNPNPYIFWGTVGSVAFFDGWKASPAHACAFMVGMYALLIGGLAMTVFLFGQVGAFSPRVNRALSVVSAIALAAFGIWQLWIGVGRLG